VTYTALAIPAVLVAVALDALVLRTRLVRTWAFWISYAIIVLFQLAMNGTLTGYRIVTCDPSTITGLRVVMPPSRIWPSDSR
jgi:lycopene cyclase domain-containing protein